MLRLLRLAVLLPALLAASLPAAAHAGKARFHVVVDTDGAADDLRALCLLAGNREVELLAVTSSDGALPPDETARRVAALLHAFHHEGIPVGAGRPTVAEPPHFRAHSRQIDWGDTTAVPKAFPPAAELMAARIAAEPEPVTIVALGALTNCCDLLQRHPALAGRIERIVWYDDRAGGGTGANTHADPPAARRVLACGVPVEIVSADPQTPLPVAPLLDTFAAVDTPYARTIVATHRAAPLDARCRSGHLALWDDLCVLRLFAPELFAVQPLQGAVCLCTLQDGAEAADALTAVLRGRPDAESRVLWGFPADPALYAADVAPLVDAALRRHGASEWRAAVLTNELHGHLGIYATIGVKMGIRAREYFAIGVDDLFVTSFAGEQPPVSCLNDGLQVGTGATVGHGLLAVAKTGPPRPEALFRFKDTTIRLRLRPEVAARIRDDVALGVARFGPDSEAYWQYIRTLALRYWLELDRHAIFELTVEP